MSEVRNEDRKLTRKDKRYLNSKARIVKRFFMAIVGYAVIIIAMMLIACYIKNGNLDDFVTKLGGMKDWFRPGGMMFNAIVGYLPIIVIGCIGAYFGEGTVGKMIFGIMRCFLVIAWLVLVFHGASTSLQLPDVMNSIGVEELTVGLDGLIKFACLVLLCSVLIPIGEFAGARKKHKKALEKKERLTE